MAPTERGGESDQPAMPAGDDGNDIFAMAMDDHDVTAALFDSLGGTDIAFHDETIDEFSLGNNWQLDQEDELAGMLMALDDDENEVDNVNGGQHAIDVPAMPEGVEGVEAVEVDHIETPPVGKTLPSPDATADSNDVASQKLEPSTLVEDRDADTDSGAADQALRPQSEELKEELETDGTASSATGDIEPKGETGNAESDVTAALLDSLEDSVAERSSPVGETEVKPEERDIIDVVPESKAQPSAEVLEQPQDDAAAVELATEETPETEDGKSTVARQEARVCVVCEIQSGKYKCPLCAAPFCSVACNRIHKENHPPAAEKPAEKPPAPPQAKRKLEDDDPYSVLLEHRLEFQKLFKKYPSLEDELNRIGMTTNPPANGLMSIKQKHGYHKKPRMWTKEEGLRRGAAALRKARTDPSERGDAVRDYCELVLHLLSIAGGSKATRRLHEEVTAGDAKAIEHLMKEETEKD